MGRGGGLFRIEVGDENRTFYGHLLRSSFCFSCHEIPWLCLFCVFVRASVLVSAYT